MAAGELEVANLIVLDIQQGDQCDFFLFALGAGLLQQSDGVAPFDKTLFSERGDMIEIVITQALWNTTNHGTANLFDPGTGPCSRAYIFDTNYTLWFSAQLMPVNKILD